MFFNRSSSYIFARCAVKRQLIPWKYFNIHITYIYIFRTRIWLRDNFPSFRYSGKFALITSLRKSKRLIAFISVHTIQHPGTLRSNTYHSNKRVPRPFFHSNTNPVFGHPVFGHVLIHYFDKTHVLAGTVELICLLLLNIILFNFAPASNKLLFRWQDSEKAM